MSSPLRLSVDRSALPLPDTACAAPRVSMRLPSKLGVIEEAVDVVARHCESQGLPGQRARFHLRVPLKLVVNFEFRVRKQNPES